MILLIGLKLMLVNSRNYVAIILFKVNGISVKIGVEIKNEVTKLNRITRDNGSLEVVAYQKGGDVTGLARIFSGENGQTVPAFSCSLNNLKACTQALDKIVQYIASKEFAEGVKSSPAILNYAYRPYWEVDPDVPEELKTSEVSTAIENARIRLAEAYENITIDQETLAKTLQLDLAANRQQELVGLATQLRTDAENVQKAALICFSDLEACVSNTDKVLANVVAYDRKIVEINPFSDGLVAYYPFNGNAKDESDNGNDGTVNGATLTKDRFGKKNSAYDFDGLNDHILVEHSSQFTSIPITVFAWLYPREYKYAEIITKLANCNNYGWAFKWRIKKENLYFNFYDTTGKNVQYRGGHRLKYPIISLNKWILITVTYDGTNGKAFLNGEEIDNFSSAFEILNVQNYLAIGGNFIERNVCGYPTEFFNGIIDEVRIYNRALSSQEIQQFYNHASNNCKANLLDRKLEIPCVSVPNVIVGGTEIYSVELTNTPLTKRFDVDLNTLKKHTFQDSCLAKYSFKTGSLNLPCVNVPNDRDYVMKMQQRSGTLVFDLIDSQ